ERVELKTQVDNAPHPPEQRVRAVVLQLDVAQRVVVFRVDNDRQKELLRVSVRKSGVPVGAPLHGRTDAVPIAQVDVVAHPDLVTVIQNGRTGQRQQQPVQ